MKKRKLFAVLTLAGLMTIGSPMLPANAAWKTTPGGTMYTQTQAPGYYTGLKKINSYYYYFDNKGIMQTGLQTIDKKLYYFGEQNNNKGIMQMGWITAGNKKYYADKNGILAVNKWVDNCYLQEDGSLAVNKWIEGKWVGADGKYTGVKNNVGWVTDKGKTYYYDSNSRLTKGWLNVDGKTYYMDPNSGVLKKGWIKVGGKSYYAGPKKGVILKNQWYSSKYLKSDGSVATGLTKVGKKTYLFDSKGKKKTGWQKYGGKTYHFSSKGVMDKSKWIGKKYVNSSGTLASGWTTIGKYDYYFTSGGTKKTGWITVDKKRYFLNKLGQLQKKRWLWSKTYYASKDGSVLKGLNAVGGKIYYFHATTGKKIVNTQKTIGRDTYYFQKDGSALKNKWQKIKNKYYYFQSNGTMAKSTWVGKYYVDANGVRTNQVKPEEVKPTQGWSSDKQFYFNSDGSKATGWTKIGNDQYFFAKDGKKVTGLLVTGGKKYYCYPDGPMAASTKIIIGAKQYTLNAEGVVTNEESVLISGSTKGAKIVQYAQQFVGNKYVYGGNSLTNGVDCSGFTQQVFKHFGYSLLRVADDQMKGPSEALIKKGYTRGKAIPISSIQAGDLLFYGSGNYASHVAIYMGNGKIVHASNSQPYPKGGIKISDYNYQKPIKAMRYWS